MSHLIKEDDEFLHLREYVHHDSDEYSDWMLDENGNLKYPNDIIYAADGCSL